MAISTNGGSNPLSVQFIQNGTTYNCNEVWYKNSPSAESIMVWPDNKCKIILAYGGTWMSEPPSYTVRVKYNNTVKKIITHPGGRDKAATEVVGYFDEYIGYPYNIDIYENVILADKANVIITNNGIRTDNYEISPNVSWSRPLEIKQVSNVWKITGATSTFVRTIQGLDNNSKIKEIKFIFQSDNTNTAYFNIEITADKTNLSTDDLRLRSDNGRPMYYVRWNTSSTTSGTLEPVGKGVWTSYDTGKQWNISNLTSGAWDKHAIFTVEYRPERYQVVSTGEIKWSPTTFYLKIGNKTTDSIKVSTSGSYTYFGLKYDSQTSMWMIAAGVSEVYTWKQASSAFQTNFTKDTVIKRVDISCDGGALEGKQSVIINFIT